MKRERITPFQRKLAYLGADILPSLGTALGALAGGVGAPVGGALGGIASAGLKGLIPQQQMMGQQNQNPLVFGPENEDYINLYPMQQQMYGMPQQGQNMQQFGNALGMGIGAAGNAGISSLLSLLGSGSNPAVGADSSLREKLVRIIALKQALGRM